MESLGGLVASAPDVTRLMMELSLSTKRRRRVLFPDREAERARLTSGGWTGDLAPGSGDGVWALGSDSHINSLFLHIDRRAPLAVGRSSLHARWHGGLWDGTRGATYVFPSTAPELERVDHPPGLQASRDPTPFGATFTELRNLNPSQQSDHLYPWIRELLAPPATLSDLTTGAGDLFRLIRLMLGSSFGAADSGATIGVLDWGASFEEVDP
jgi:hypothetical protein